ncbi:helix-turn-helix domain-containing protein [Amycolatopsis roodepoortensis]
MLSRVRLWRRWSRDKTARKAGMKYQTLSRYETGERVPTKVSAIMRLADALGMPRQQLFNWVVNEIEHREKLRNLGHADTCSHAAVKVTAPVVVTRGN